MKTPPEELEGKKLTQGDSFVYLGRALCGRREDGEDAGLGLRRRAQAGANSWRAVEGVMADRRISKRKGWRMADYRRERQNYVRRAGGDEGGKG